LFKRQYHCGRAKGGVSIDSSEFLRGGEGNGEPVGDANGSMSAGSCAQRIPPMLIGRVAVSLGIWREAIEPDIDEQAVVFARRSL
jgi:hypothetical protein